MKTWHWIALGIITLISLVLEFVFLADYDSHWWNAIPGFYIIFGFVGCYALIYFAKWIGKLFILREEDYYDN